MYHRVRRFFWFLTSPSAPGNLEEWYISVAASSVEPTVVRDPKHTSGFSKYCNLGVCHCKTVDIYMYRQHKTCLIYCSLINLAYTCMHPLHSHHTHSHTHTPHTHTHIIPSTHTHPPDAGQPSQWQWWGRQWLLGTRSVSGGRSKRQEESDHQRSSLGKREWQLKRRGLAETDKTSVVAVIGKVSACSISPC